jgi:hypothetical protein
VLASDTDATLNLYDPFDTPGRAIECYGWLLLVSMLLVVVTGVALTGRQSCKNRKRLGTIPLTDALFSLNLDPALHPDAAAAHTRLGEPLHEHGMPASGLLARSSNPLQAYRRSALWRDEDGAPRATVVPGAELPDSKVMPSRPLDVLQPQPPRELQLQLEPESQTKPEPQPESQPRLEQPAPTLEPESEPHVQPQPNRSTQNQSYSES